MVEIRKLESSEDREKKEQKNSKMIGMVLLFLMVISTVGYAFLYNPNTSSSTGSVNGTGIVDGEVQNIGNQWVLQREGQQLVFASSPESTANISVDINSSLSDYYDGTLYISSNISGVESEIAYNLGRYAPRTQQACYGSCNDTNLPEKNCTANIIVYYESNENRVYQKDRCVFIEGDIRAADAFLYKLLKT